MDIGIIDQQLQFARQLPKEVLESDSNLEAGYDNENKTWELIVKYSGDITRIAQEIDLKVEILSYGYAIIIIKENLIDRLSQFKEIEYIEKPRRLYFSIYEGKEASCINDVKYSGIELGNYEKGLTGKGVIVAIIDSGIDYAHKDFRNNDGTSRIIRLWDQTVEGNPPQGFLFGTEYTKKDIDLALTYTEKNQQLKIVNSIDITGHGTHVAGIACGNGTESKNKYEGIASLSDIIVVKIGNSIGDSYPMTTRIMEALEYVLKIAIELSKPIAINLSFGNNYGDHLGNSLLEQYIDLIASTWKNIICIGSGNEGEDSKHKEGIMNDFVENIELSIGENQNYVSLQLWKNFKDDFDLSIISPNGLRININEYIRNTASYNIGNNIIYVYYGEPTPFNAIQEINIILYPKVDYVERGIWILEITPKNVIDGRYDIWLGSTVRFNKETGFIESDVYKTLTIPSTARRALTVGAYDAKIDRYAPFSGRGAQVFNTLMKPDIVAPGVDIISTKVNGGYESRTGTSMATPFVTGSAALMLEWGIVKENDIYLYGQKIKAYIIKGARKLDEYKEYPNANIGWGALCLRNSIPTFGNNY